MGARAVHHAPGSFRDPSGFVFFVEGEVYRQVNPSYLPVYEKLKRSGLLDTLSSSKLLISHAEEESDREKVIIRPEQIPFISYPYEWCFSQLKDAALLTLQVQKLSLEKGFSLKDASAYNVQFLRGRPIFIDTLSFEQYREGSPWVAYRQFCQHFLAPLALMAETDISLGRLAELYLDGIPLELASRLLPRRTRLSLGLLPHIHLHAKAQAKHGKARTREAVSGKLSMTALLALIDSLEGTVKKLKPHRQETEWEHYYDFTNYSGEAETSKKEAIGGFLSSVKPKAVWDFGANTGEYSRLASSQGILTVASDIDPLAVERCYREVKKSGEESLLPLVIDLTNPSPPIGWDNEEREAFLRRNTADLVMALALVHHLAISNNLPLERIARSFARLSPYLVIEFIPKEDSQVKKLLTTREDIFPGYTQEGFERSFDAYYTVLRRVKVKDSQRTLYLLKRKGRV